MVLDGSHILTARERLVVALDTKDEQVALQLADTLSEMVSTFKVGLQLFSACGPSIIHKLRERGARVFLDLKMHDIPNTVSSALEVAIQPGVYMVDVHATGGRAMLEAAVEAVRNSAERQGMPAPKLLGITVLTNLHNRDLQDIGMLNRQPNESGDTIEQRVRHLSRLCQEAGLDGVVASPHEIKAIREETSPGFLVVTPGIRQAGADVNDQVRIATPTRALRAGASFLVVGRPIIAADDPLEAARQIVREMEDAFLIA